ncbi:MAG TPA: cation diffusion facilitator family transporter [Polyangiaceae bacterium]|nr:cation diffusion facilitator family transporter [Polyangiaceae bacterium]
MKTAGRDHEHDPGGELGHAHDGAHGHAHDGAHDHDHGGHDHGGHDHGGHDHDGARGHGGRDHDDARGHGGHDHGGHDRGGHDRGGHGHGGHGHGGHGHGHGHGHGALEGRAFAVGTALNLAFVAIEFGYGLAAHSMALVADAAHNLGDVLGLLLAWAAAVLARRKPSPRRTYGLRSSTILAALANAVLLLMAVGAVSWEAFGRLREAGPVEGKTVLGVAAVGVLFNGASALLFVRGSKDDVNVRGAFLHLAADAAVSAGVVVAGGLIMVTGWAWLDPAVSLAVSAVVLAGAWSLLRDALNLALQSVPDRIDPDEVRRYLAGLPGVDEVHDLHIWAMSTTEVALTAHLVMPGASYHASFLHDAGRALHDKFRIDHATLQVEPSGAEACRHADEGVV